MSNSDSWKTRHLWDHRPRDLDIGWQDKARCFGIDPNLFVPDRDASNADIEAAKAVCALCPVQGPCLEYALRHRLAGIYAGTAERDRRLILRRRRSAASAA